GPGGRGGPGGCAGPGGRADPADMEIFDLYQNYLKEKNALDLDDLILETIRVLEIGPAGPGFLKKGLSHILIDEYQDINPPQARFVKILTERGAGLFAIGDPDQAVYSFRGSSLESFMNFEREFPGSSVIRLERNYRSTENIVRASDSVISNNRERVEKGSQAVKEGGEVFLVSCGDERSLTEYIIKEIEKMMGGFYSQTAGGRGVDLRFSDFAVLFRTNRQGEAILDAFKKSAIPCRLSGPAGVSFMDLLKRLKEGTPDGGISLVDFIKEEARVLNAAPEVMQPFLSVAKRVDGEKADSPLDVFITEMALLEPADNLDIKADMVNLMTLHTAKGLEFRCVFIAGVEDGLIPLCREGTDMEEERRLFYVGMTRAVKSLYLLSASKRRAWGEVVESAPSPFIGEIPQALLKKVNIKKKAYKRRPVQNGFFD
ncbi:MAG: ATP-dependent helicase, partial [Thermodesulfobacteriota bacterium]